MCEWPGKIIFAYAGIGIAMVTLIESMVRVTIRHSDSEPIASEAATVRISRDEATGAERPLKPVAPGDRIMAQDPSTRGRITRDVKNFAGIAGNIAATAPRKRQNHGDCSGYARYSRGLSLGSDTGGIVDFNPGPPIHGDEAGGLLDPPQP
jgi:hypothetical protein